MLEKQANSLTFLAQYIASKVGATGLTVTVDVWEIQQDGTATEIVTAGSATEIGDGLYRYILAAVSVDANAEYICVFKTASATVDQQHLAAVYSVGRAGVANLDATVSSRATAASIAALNDLTATEVEDAVWDAVLANHQDVGSTGEALDDATTGTIFPAGAIQFTYTVTNSVSGLPLEGVEVWISTDNPAVNIVWKGDTDAFGVARDVNGDLPSLDVGTYYFWRQLAGFVFSDPDTETVS